MLRFGLYHFRLSLAMTASGKKNHCIRPNRVSINTPSKNKEDKRSVVEKPERTTIKKVNDKVQIFDYDTIRKS